MESLLIKAFSVYIITAVLTDGYIFEPIRIKIRRRFPSRRMIHFVDCRLCMGFWVALIITGYTFDVWNFLTVYGISYFIATQEKI